MRLGKSAYDGKCVHIQWQHAGHLQFAWILRSVQQNNERFLALVRQQIPIGVNQFGIDSFELKVSKWVEGETLRKFEISRTNKSNGGKLVNRKIAVSRKCPERCRWRNGMPVRRIPTRPSRTRRTVSLATASNQSWLSDDIKYVYIYL